MKKRWFLWALPLALLLTSAFLGPRLLLQQEQKAALGETHLLDASAFLLEDGTDAFAKKLSVLTERNIQSIELPLEEDAGPLRAALTAELEELVRLGAVPASILPPDVEEAEILRLCIVSPSLSLLFEVYDFYLPSEGIHAYLDRSTGKLLNLSFRGEAAEEETKLLFELDGARRSADQARAWANYYGLTAAAPETISPEELERFLRDGERPDYLPGVPVLRMRLLDGGNEAISFCLYFNSELGDPVYAWNPELRP